MFRIKTTQKYLYCYIVYYEILWRYHKKYRKSIIVQKYYLIEKNWTYITYFSSGNCTYCQRYNMLFVSKLLCEPTKSIFLKKMDFSLQKTKHPVQWSPDISIHVYLEISWIRAFLSIWTSMAKALFSMSCGSLHGVCYSLKEQIGEWEKLR